MKIATRFLCLAAGCAFALAAAQAQTPGRQSNALQDEQWAKHRDAGDQAFRKGDTAGAEQAFRSALERAEQLKQPLLVGYSRDCLAELYRQQRKFGEARREYEAALVAFRAGSDRDLPVAQDYFGVVAQFYSEQKWEAELMELVLQEQLRAAEQGSDAATNMMAVMGITMMAQAQINKGDEQKADSYLKRMEAALKKNRLLSHAPRPDPVQEAVMKALREGKPDEAERVYRAEVAKAEAKDPHSVAAAENLERLAAFYTQQHRPDEARPLLKRALALRRAALERQPGHNIAALNAVSRTLESLIQTHSAFVPAQIGAPPPPPPPAPPRTSAPAGANAPRLKDPARPPLPVLPDGAGGLSDPIQVQAKPVVVAQPAVTVAEPSRVTAAELAEIEELRRLDLALWEKHVGAAHPLVADKLTALAAVEFEKSTEFRRRYREQADALWSRANGGARPNNGVEEQEAMNAYFKQAGITDPHAAAGDALLRRALAVTEHAFGAADHRVVKHLSEMKLHYGLYFDPAWTEAIDRKLAEIEARPPAPELTRREWKLKEIRELRLAGEEEKAADIERRLEKEKSLPFYDPAGGMLRLWRPVPRAAEVPDNSPSLPAVPGWRRVDLRALDTRTGVLRHEFEPKWVDYEFRVNGGRLLAGLRSQYAARPLKGSQFAEINPNTGGVKILTLAEHAALWEQAAPATRRPHTHESKREWRADKDGNYHFVQAGANRGVAESADGRMKAVFSIHTTTVKRKDLISPFLGGTTGPHETTDKSVLKIEIFDGAREVSEASIERGSGWESALCPSWEDALDKEGKEAYERRLAKMGEYFRRQQAVSALRPMSWVKVGERYVLLFDDIEQADPDDGHALILFAFPPPR